MTTTTILIVYWLIAGHAIYLERGDLAIRASGLPGWVSTIAAYVFGGLAVPIILMRKIVRE